MLNRTQEPIIKEPGRLEMPPIEKQTLSNGIPLYVVNMGDTDVSRIDVIFKSGKYDQHHPLAAEMCNVLLKEGTARYNSSEIAEKLDFYGAWLQTSSALHNSNITLYSMNRFFDETIDILADIIQYPVFPESEFSILLERRKRKQIIDSAKVSVIANDELAKNFFGPQHPYGYVVGMPDYDTITTADVRRFHREYYTSQNCMIVITGKITPHMLSGIEERFGSDFLNSSSNIERVVHPIIPTAKKYSVVEKNDALQSAVCMALKTVDRQHPDCSGIRVLNTILGGYFGSRLMANIREDKGYTYGIHSAIYGRRDISYLMIASQTGVECTQPLIKETLYEIDRLSREVVGNDELNCVKRYMQGEMCRYFDGPFSTADSYISLLLNNLDFDYYIQQYNYIKEVSSDELQRIAQTYFVPDNFYIAVGGKEK